MSFADWLGYLPADWPTRLLLALVPVFLGILLQWLFRRKGRDIALRASIATLSAIQDLSANPRLSVRYGDMPIPNLLITTILVWNAGRQPIRRENVAPSDTIRVRFPAETRLLEANLFFQTRAASAAQVSPEEQGIRIEFDFLNPKDALLIHCLHTGSASKVELTGELIGSSPSLISQWEHQVGIHGGEAAKRVHVVDPQHATVWGVITLSGIASVLVGAYLFRSWALAMTLATALFLMAVMAAWQRNPIPRSVRRALRTLQQGPSEKVES